MAEVKPSILERTLEVEACCELTNAGIVGLIQAHDTVAGAARGGAGTTKVGSVENIEELAANLEGGALMDWEFLEERGVGKRVYACPDGLYAGAESVKSVGESLLEGRYRSIANTARNVSSYISSGNLVNTGRVLIAGVEVITAGIPEIGYDTTAGNILGWIRQLDSSAAGSAEEPAGVRPEYAVELPAAENLTHIAWAGGETRQLIDHGQISHQVGVSVLEALGSGVGRIQVLERRQHFLPGEGPEDAQIVAHALVKRDLSRVVQSFSRGNIELGDGSKLRIWKVDE